MSDRIILNTTKFNLQRWVLEGDELVNHKTRYPLADFFNSDHPEKETVRGYFADKGISDRIPSAGEPVSFHEALGLELPDDHLYDDFRNDGNDMPADLAALSETYDGFVYDPLKQGFQPIIMSIIEDRTYGSVRIANLFVHINCTQGKGATRQLRKQLHAAGYTALAAVSAAWLSPQEAMRYLARKLSA